MIDQAHCARQNFRYSTASKITFLSKVHLHWYPNNHRLESYWKHNFLLCKRLASAVLSRRFYFCYVRAWNRLCGWRLATPQLAFFPHLFAINTFVAKVNVKRGPRRSKMISLGSALRYPGKIDGTGILAIKMGHRWHLWHYLNIKLKKCRNLHSNSFSFQKFNQLRYTEICHSHQQDVPRVF